MNTQDIFLAIADPSRRQILHLLSTDKMSINTLAENFDMSRPAVSKHIKMLEHCGFVMIQDIGRERYCTLNKQGFDELHDWLNYYDNFWKTSVSKLQQLLDANHPVKAKGGRKKSAS